MFLRGALSSLRPGFDEVAKWNVARLALGVILVIAAAGCDRARQAVATFGAGDEHAAAPAAPLAPAVIAALQTREIDTSTLEHRVAAPGNTFVVLDVIVRNPDARPQVFSEGTLVSVDAKRQRRFPTPVTLLADEFLTLQVLQPASAVRGKIAYEVPSGLRGVWYWQPGAPNQRILLHLGAPRVETTLGNASDDAIVQGAGHTPAPAAAKPAARQRVATAESPVRVQTGSAAVAASPGVPAPAARSHHMPVSSRSFSSAGAAPSDVSAGNEQARTLACQALLSRNDPAEKARYLGFFARECSDYAMPSRWRPGLASVAPARVAPPPPSGPAFDCSQAWSRAEHLVCADAVLSLMDRQLDRAYAEARLRVADPTALQRAEDDWRHRVRDACDSIPCIERAYDQRTAELQAAGRDTAVR